MKPYVWVNFILSTLMDGVSGFVFFFGELVPCNGKDTSADFLLLCLPNHALASAVASIMHHFISSQTLMCFCWTSILSEVVKWKSNHRGFHSKSPLHLLLFHPLCHSMYAQQCCVFLLLVPWCDVMCACMHVGSHVWVDIPIISESEIHETIAMCTYTFLKFCFSS